MAQRVVLDRECDVIQTDGVLLDTGVTVYERCGQCSRCQESWFYSESGEPWWLEAREPDGMTQRKATLEEFSLFWDFIEGCFS